MKFRNEQLTTLVLKITVANTDVESLKGALLEAVEDDFEAVFSTDEKKATNAETKAYNQECIDDKDGVQRRRTHETPESRAGNE